MRNQGSFMNHAVEKLRNGTIKITDDFIRLLNFAYAGIHIIAITAERYTALLTKWIPDAMVGLLRLFHTIAQKGMNKLQDWVEEKRKKRIYKNLIGKMAMVKHPFLKTYFFSFVISTMIWGLQIISFNTTHSGAEYYMLHIKKWAPVVFAGVIQGTIIVLSLTAFDSAVKDTRRKVGLVVAVLISIGISYVGIVNGTINPASVYDEVVRKYRTDYGFTKAEILAHTEIAMSEDDVIKEITDSLNTIESRKTAVEDTMTALKGSAGLKNTSTTVTEAVDSATGTITKNTGSSSAYILSGEEIKKIHSDEAKVNGLLGSMPKPIDLAELDREFRNSVKNGEMSEKLKEMDRDYQVFINNWGEIEQIGVLSDKIVEKDMDGISDMFHKVLEYKKIEGFEAFPEEMPSQTEEGADGWKTENSYLQRAGNILNDVFGIVLNFGSSSTETYMKEIEKLQKSAEESYGNIYNYMDETQRQTLTNSYDELMGNKDANYIAFSYLVPGNKNFTSAFVALILAILVDGGTLALAIIKEKRSYPLLYANTKNDYIDEEQDLISIVLLSMVHHSAGKEGLPQNKKMSVEAYERVCNNYLNGIVQNIHEYLKLFKISESTIGYGFGLAAEGGEIDSDKFRPITSILLELNYMTILTKGEYEQINHAFRGREYTPVRGRNADDKNVYLLRFRVENYLRSKITEGDIYQNIINQYSVSGGSGNGN